MIEGFDVASKPVVRPKRYPIQKHYIGNRVLFGTQARSAWHLGGKEGGGAHFPCFLSFCGDGAGSILHIYYCSLRGYSPPPGLSDLLRLFHLFRQTAINM